MLFYDFFQCKSGGYKMIQYDPDINIYLLYLDSVDISVTPAGLDSKILT